MEINLWAYLHEQKTSRILKEKTNIMFGNNLNEILFSKFCLTIIFTAVS